MLMPFPNPGSSKRYAWGRIARYLSSHPIKYILMTSKEVRILALKENGTEPEVSNEMDCSFQVLIFALQFTSYASNSLLKGLSVLF